MNRIRLGEIARRVGGRLVGEDVAIRGVAAPEDAEAEDIAPVTGRRAPPPEAGAWLIERAIEGRPQVVVMDVRHALPALLAIFAPPDERAPGVDPRAAVDPAARVDSTASVGPFAVVGAGATVAAGARVEAHAYVGAAAEIGAGARLLPHAVVLDGCRVGARAIVGPGADVGADGFGFQPDGAGGLRKVPSLGRVEIEADAEIGANATIDRATLGATRVGRGAKLDDQVHVGHNAEVGEGACLCGQTGLSGSVRVGAGALLGGQVGVADHLAIGAGARVAAKSGVTRDVPPGTTFAGYPAMPRVRWLRAIAALRKGG